MSAPENSPSTNRDAIASSLSAPETDAELDAQNSTQAELNGDSRSNSADLHADLHRATHSTDEETIDAIVRATSSEKTHPTLTVITNLSTHLQTQGLTPTQPSPPPQLKLERLTPETEKPPSNLSPESPPDPPLDLLPGIDLTPEQQQALQRLETFLDSGDKIYLLTGYAGTGKTTLLQALLVHLQSIGDDRPIAFTALSNKATKVLSTMATHWDLKVDCLTCCRLLGLQPTIDKETGQQKFTSDRKGKRLINRYRLVVVDECSMINQEMWELLVKAVSRLDDQTQLLFVGDEAQLPPVGEAASPCFEQIYDRTQLTEVVRYGGAIGLLAEDVRRNLERPRMPRWESDRNTDNTQGTFILPPQQWDKLLLRAFTSESYNNSPDQVRVLAYTNRRVQQLNQRIRTAIYGPKAVQFVSGERLMASSPCMLDDNQVILQTSEECEVLDANIDYLDDPVVMERWRIWNMEIITEAGLSREVQVLHGQEKQRFNKVLKSLADGRSWKAFWELKQHFHDLNYAYSLTVHKSQGSTFQDVFVDLPNLMINRKVTERNQLCYVAFTRAANRLFLPYQ